MSNFVGERQEAMYDERNSPDDDFDAARQLFPWWIGLNEEDAAMRADRNRKIAEQTRAKTGQASIGSRCVRRAAQWLALGLVCACGLAQAPSAKTVDTGAKAAATSTAAGKVSLDASPTIDSRPHLSGSETTTAVPLKITLTPSETPLKIGSTSNMAATIQNISDAPVSIMTSTLQLTTPAIVGGRASKCVVDIPESTLSAAINPQVTLQPQDSMIVLFNLSQPARYAAPTREANESEVAFQQAEANYRSFLQSCNMGWSGPIQRVLDFSPGDYGYYLQGDFTLCTDPKQGAGNPACSEPWRNFSASASFAVGIDQTTIVIFAVLGGWLAMLYVIFSKASQPGSILHDFNAALTEFAPEEKSKNPVGRFLQKLMTSSGARAAGRFVIRLIATAILSAAVTVISSRISNPSLPIRISVMDAWGAMTIGFLSYFIGAKFISSLTDWSSGAPTPGAPTAGKSPENSAV